MSHLTECLAREFDTAYRVCFELGNAAADAYEEATLELFDLVSAGAGLSHVEAQKIYTLFEAYEVKRDAAAEAEIRKDAAVIALFTELRHPHPA